MKPEPFNRRAFLKSAVAADAVTRTTRRSPPVQQSQSTPPAAAGNPGYARPNAGEQSFNEGGGEQTA